ncbi:MAG: BREX system ATP-binding domain-containing protein [Candidatus Thermoplasmatota archaeon]
MESTIKERVLLHLGNYPDTIAEQKAPYYISQGGIAEAIDGSLSQVSRVLRKMKEEGLVNEKRNYLTHDHKRKKKTYTLTSNGSKNEKKLRRKLRKKKITVRTDDGKKEIKGAELKNHLENDDPLLYATIHSDHEGVLDLTDEEKKFSFVDREEEMRRLKEKLEGVKEDGCSIIFFVGRAGTGKTALAQKFKEYAEENGFVFLQGEAYYETSDPYLPFKKAFKGHEDFEEKLSPFSRVDLNSKSIRSISDQDTLQAERRFAFYEFTNELRKLAREEPLVIFLDDVQWADKATLQLLHYMVDNLTDSPIFFLTAYRSESVTDDHPVKELSSRLSRDKHYEELVIEPFERDDTRQMLNSGIDLTKVPTDFVDLIHRMTEGNPLFIKEFTEFLRDEEELPTNTSDYPTEDDDVEVPQIIEEVFRRRLNLHLSEKAQNIAEIGSIIGDQFHFDLIKKCLNIDELELCDGIDELLETGILKEIFEGNRFTFNHGLMSTIIYEDISKANKKMMHKIVAENIEELYDDQIEKYYSDLAHHYQRAEKLEKAIEYYINAGERAEKIYAHEDAIEMYEHALDLTEEDRVKIDLLVKLGKAHKIIGEYDSALDEFETAVEKTEEVQLKQNILSLLGETYLSKGDHEQALNTAEKGLSLSNDDQNEMMTCKLLSVKGRVYSRRRNIEKAENIFSEEKEIAEKEDNDKEKAKALHHIGSLRIFEGNNDEALDALSEAVELRKKINDQLGLSRSLNNLGIIYKNKGQFDKALDYFNQILEIQEEIGDKSGIMKTLNNLGIISKIRGDLKTALDYYDKSLEIGKKIEDKFSISMTNVNLGNIYKIQCEHEEALNHFEKAYEIQKDIDDKSGMAATLNNIGSIYQTIGDFEEALEYLNESLEIGKKIDDKSNIASSLYNLGEVHKNKEEFEKARDHYEKSLKLCEEIGNNRLNIHILCDLAEVKLESDEQESALKQAKKALKIAKNLDAIKEKGMAHESIGRIYREKGKFEEAKDEFTSAQNLYDNIGNEDDCIKLSMRRVYYSKKKIT